MQMRTPALCAFLPRVLPALQLSHREQLRGDRVVLSESHPFLAVTVAAPQVLSKEGKSSPKGPGCVELRRKSVLFLTNLSTCQRNWLGSDDVSYEHLWDTVIPFGALQLQAEGERGPCRHGQMLPVFLGSFQL